MFKKIAMSTMLALAAQVSYADDASVAAAAKLADSMHLQERISGFKLQAQAMGQRQIDQIVTQIQKSVPQLSDTQKTAIRVAASEFIASVSNSWSSEEVAKIYTGSLIKDLPPEVIGKITDFYSTEQGQMALKASSNADQSIVSYISSAQEKAMATSYPVLMDNFKSIITGK